VPGWSFCIDSPSGTSLPKLMKRLPGMVQVLT
jgi:hypothetical protein